MKNYLYQIYRIIDHKTGEAIRIDTCTRFEDFEKQFLYYLDQTNSYDYFAQVFENNAEKTSYQFFTKDDLESFRTALERNTAWNPFEEDENITTKKHEGPLNVDLHVKKINKQFETLLNRKVDAIDPPHYQGYVDEYQWLETMCRIPRYRERPDEFVAALELQIRKYLDRNGRKDDGLQELQKGLWYYKFMVAYIKAGKKPILVSDVEQILKGN
jgi:hypothetical protein